MREHELLNPQYTHLIFYVRSFLLSRMEPPFFIKDETRNYYLNEFKMRINQCIFEELHQLKDEYFFLYTLMFSRWWTKDQTRNNILLVSARKALNAKTYFCLDCIFSYSLLQKKNSLFCFVVGNIFIFRFCFASLLIYFF